MIWINPLGLWKLDVLLYFNVKSPQWKRGTVDSGQETGSRCYDGEDTGDGPACLQRVLNVPERVCVCVCHDQRRGLGNAAGRHDVSDGASQRKKMTFDISNHTQKNANETPVRKRIILPPNILLWPRPLNNVGCENMLGLCEVRWAGGFTQSQEVM